MAEGDGRPDDARRCFERAWETRTDPFEAAIAAHYLARHQSSPESVLHWNQTALDEALLVEDARKNGLLPSLYLNLGKSLEDLGRPAEARRQYELASASADALGDDGYGRMMRQGIAAGLERSRAYSGA